MNAPSHAHHDWELCNDDGFVYRRRKKRSRSPAPAPAPAQSDPHTLQRRRRKTLLKLRDEYRTEIRQWESLSAELHRMKISRSRPASPATYLSQIPHGQVSAGVQVVVVDRLLAQAEAQGEIINGVLRLCDAVTAMYHERRRQIFHPLFDLPIWGSPRSLLAALTEVDGARKDVGDA